MALSNVPTDELVQELARRLPNLSQIPVLEALSQKLERLQREVTARHVELSEMSYDDETVRPLLDLEGLKVWKDGRTDGYALLDRAIDRFGAVDDFVSNLAERNR